MEGGGFSPNVIIFGVDNSSSVYADNRKKEISILGKTLRDRLDDTAETKNNHRIKPKIRNL